MKASIVLAAAMAMLATASPLEKRKYAVHKVVATVTEFRYPDGSIAKPTGRNGGWRDHRRPHGKPNAKPTAAPKAPAPPAKKPEEEAPPAKKLPELPEVPEVDLPVPDAGKPSYAPPPAPVGDDEISVALYSTNLHRANHSASALVWDDHLASVAAGIASRCDFEHDTDEDGVKFGQNLAWKGSTGSQLSPSDAVAHAISEWYNSEFFKFPYFGSNPPRGDGNFGDYGHLTALLWKGTEKMGCACYRCPRGTLSPIMDAMYTVCNYLPAGNYDGQYAENVSPPLGNPAYII